MNTAINIFPHVIALFKVICRFLLQVVEHSQEYVNSELFIIGALGDGSVGKVLTTVPVWKLVMFHFIFVLGSGDG